MEKTLKAVTHSGAFHADDVFAHAALAAALGGRMDFSRTRDPAAIEAADIAFDVGGVFDPARGRFDHHQRGAPRRPCGGPYSSAGLVWEAFGPAALLAILPGVGPLLRHEVWRRLDRDFVLPIDRLDVGEATDDALSLSAIVETFAAAWDEEGVDADARFLEASAMVARILGRQARHALAAVRARAAVLAAAPESDDPRLLVLERYAPWHEAAHEELLPALYAVYPGSTPGEWMVNAMPTAPGRTDQKRPLPAAWAGMRGAELAAASGVPDAVFCHLGRFVCAARSREGALALARKALEDRP